MTDTTVRGLAASALTAAAVVVSIAAPVAANASDPATAAGPGACTWDITAPDVVIQPGPPGPGSIVIEGHPGASVYC